MGDQSGIEWTDATWNWVVGCTPVSAGCDHCYAQTLHTMRHNAYLGGTFPDAPKQYHEPFETVQLIPERLEMPLRWTKPRKIFVNSLADVFHKDVPDSIIDQAFGVMAACPEHTFQLLTKRPQRMRRYLNDPETKKRIWHAGRPIVEASSRAKRLKHGSMYDLVPVAVPGGGLEGCYPAQWPLPNVWIGTSVESQEVDFRIKLLAETPAAVRFLSCEPLLGPLTIWPWLMPDSFIDWVIVGGESGEGHRPIGSDWVRSLRDQCVETKTAFLFKQWGGRTSKAGGRELDGRTWDEYPGEEAA